MNDNLLDASTTLKCCDLPTNTVTIAFLNVRSIMGKLPDIEADMNFTNAGFYDTPGISSAQTSHIKLFCACIVLRMGLHLAQRHISHFKNL